jgi:hypothetical protein
MSGLPHTPKFLGRVAEGLEDLGMPYAKSAGHQGRWLDDAPLKSAFDAQGPKPHVLLSARSGQSLAIRQTAAVDHP